MARPKLSKVEAGILAGLQDAVVHSKGEISLKERVREVAKPAPHFTKNRIKKIRKDMDLTQPLFAALLNVTVSTVRSWEQGIRNPTESANRLLQIYEVMGDAVIERLG